MSELVTRVSAFAPFTLNVASNQDRTHRVLLVRDHSTTVCERLDMLPIYMAELGMEQVWFQEVDEDWTCEQAAQARGELVEAVCETLRRRQEEYAARARGRGIC